MATMYYRPYTTEPIREGELPPGDAMDRILPEYQYIFDPDAPRPAPDLTTRKETPTGPRDLGEGTSRQPDILKVQQPNPARARGPAGSRVPEDLDRSTMNMLDYQMRELDQYRTAVQKMGQDILALRQDIRELQAENSGLRRELGRYSDTTRLMMDNQEVAGLTKPELAARYASLKTKLGSQTNELKTYKDKVQKLQNDLIKKNDIAKDHMKMTNAHGSQQRLLQKMQDKVQKVKKLEETCKSQEKVIEKMEKLLGQSQRSKNGQVAAVQREAQEALMAENKRLRSEMESLRLQDRSQVKDQTSSADDMEKLEMYQLLDKAEARISALEKQLADNSRAWGKERADLGVKLNEATHGFGRSNQVLLHDYPASPVGRFSPLRR